MNKILLATAILLCGNAYASDAQQQGASSSANTNSVAAASNQGNSQAITFTAPANTTSTQSVTTNGTQTVNQNIAGSQTQDVNYSGTQTVKNVPSVSGPNLTSSNDTCMGSTSGSANGPGFGISVGSTWTDSNCKMLKNAREMWNMGMKAAALSLMCKDPDNKEALELTGYVCPTSKRENAKTSAVKPAKSNQDTAYNGDDPLVRARMGLSTTVSAN
jgi:hypothetical protein